MLVWQPATCCWLQVDGVRIYHDQALFKSPGGGPTPWHCDQVRRSFGGIQPCCVRSWVQAVPSEAAGATMRQCARTAEAALPWLLFSPPVPLNLHCPTACEVLLAPGK